LGRVEKSIEIKASPEKVWEMLAFDRLQEWDEGAKKSSKKIEYTSEVRTPEDKYKVGASAQMNVAGEGDVDVEITESIENRKMTSIWKGKRTTLIVTFLLEPLEEGTRFTNMGDYELPWGILGKFLNKLFAQRMGQKEIERSLENLKNILEK